VLRKIGEVEGYVMLRAGKFMWNKGRWMGYLDEEQQEKIEWVRWNMGWMNLSVCC
jgi:poly(3-hydroxyalkanoate) synthetase